MKMVGALLALHREAAGLTQKSLAERIVISEDHVASIEQGRRPLKMDLAVQLDELLGTRRTLETAVGNMPDVDLVPRFAEEYLDREQEALSISWYEALVVPGLLQTEAYARAVFHSRVPVYDEDSIEQLVAKRIERRDVLHRKQPPMANFVIWEAALRDRLGGREVHIEQVRHLREYAELPGLSLQILPLGRTTHAALDGPFILLETPDHQRLAYTETQRGSRLIADLDEVAILNQKYAMLRTQARDPEETKGLLDRLLGEQ
ncbi:helix-turn-helix domain-containing protein [Streptomyces lasiicapitis]|uniref:Transcriptional regulator n=1 Tax=Streptomyces lasiicapitis TaxID=1923961 RepID=A0ABQ2LKT7_9ACTN|nr:helix-turn-helix transcriptional regulator [Streptomyces lasiicapitis]GGO38755.1 transcriptional regulator [Streptomyces lasiicapitis]